MEEDGGISYTFFSMVKKSFALSTIDGSKPSSCRSKLTNSAPLCVPNRSDSFFAVSKGFELLVELTKGRLNALSELCSRYVD